MTFREGGLNRETRLDRAARACGTCGCAVVAADQDSATRYYLSLGDSLAAGTNATGVGAAFTDLGYADQLHAALAVGDPKLELGEAGCPGESTSSMRFGSQLPSVVGSCGPPRYYKNFLYSKARSSPRRSTSSRRTRARSRWSRSISARATSTAVTCSATHFVCLFPPEDRDAEGASIAENLAAILAELRAAAGPNVPIVGMTYYNAFLPLGDPVVNARVDALNGLLASTWRLASPSPTSRERSARPSSSAPDPFCSVGDTIRTRRLRRDRQRVPRPARPVTNTRRQRCAADLVRQPDKDTRGKKRCAERSSRPLPRSDGTTARTGSRTGLGM